MPFEKRSFVPDTSISCVPSSMLSEQPNTRPPPPPQKKPSPPVRPLPNFSVVTSAAPHVRESEFAARCALSAVSQFEPVSIAFMKLYLVAVGDV